MLSENKDWTDRFLAYLREKVKGEEAWGQLVFGANPVLLIRMAAAVVADTPGEIEVIRRKRKVFAENPKAGIPRIKATAKLIRELQRETSDYRICVGQFADLSEKLTAYAHELETFAQIALENTSERLPKFADYALFFLHSYLLKATGRPQWRCLATIIEAANAACGREVEIDDDSLRKRITGMVARDSQVFTHLKRRAEEYIAGGNGDWWTREEWDQIVHHWAEQMAIDDARRFVDQHPEDEGTRAFLELIESESESKRSK